MAEVSKILRKKVIVEPKIPVTLNKDLKIVRTTGPIELTVGNIDRCMMLGARVFEVLDDGTKIMLYKSNYNKDNSHLQKNKINPNSASAQQKANAAVNNAKLTPEEKKPVPQPKVEQKPAEKADNKVDSKQEDKNNQQSKNEKSQDKKENNK